MLSNLPTLHGQNTAPPKEKVFSNHYIVSEGATYYDPSYGVKYTDKDDFEAKAIKGYGLGLGQYDLIVKQSYGLKYINFDKYNKNHNYFQLCALIIFFWQLLWAAYA